MTDATQVGTKMAKNDKIFKEQIELIYTKFELTFA